MINTKLTFYLAPFRKYSIPNVNNEEITRHRLHLRKLARVENERPSPILVACVKAIYTFSGGRICELTAAKVQTGAWLKLRSLSVSKQDFSANTTSQSGVRHFNALAGGDYLRIST